jgi:hypothetical protein
MWLLWLTACTFVTDEEWAGREVTCELEGRYLDLDGDGYGKQPARTCEEAAASVDRADDCNDGDPTVNPGATEVYYDGVDANCDELNDDDQDGDGYSAARAGGDDCYDDAVLDPVPSLEGDCDLPTVVPDPADVHPGAEDAPHDGLDANCSGGTDFDADRDGYRQCDECDDTTDEVSPAVKEVWYDGIDQDCDGNDGDQDGDGYYAADYAGEVPEGWQAGDCDDLDDERSPGAEEVWYDGVDGDCAGGDDWDRDGDGARSDEERDDEGNFGLDCDDTDPTRGPAAVEDCATTRDDNCDGDNNDVAALGCETWYADADGDGLGNPDDAVCTCTSSEAYPAEDSSDCDDSDAEVGLLSWYFDADGDGFGTSTTTSACAAPADYAATGEDCDDSDAAVYPDAPESCDAVDSDCDGDVNDPDVLALCSTTYYADLDGDGYAGTAACLCAAEAPYTESAGDDCNDAEATVSPGSPEVCNDGLDDDCDDAPGSCAFAGSLTSADANLQLYGTSDSDQLGGALVAAGDLDGDGLDEYFVGAVGYDDGGGAGLVALVRPMADSSVEATPFAVVGSDLAAGFAAVFVSAGDVDGDGLGDVLFGEPNTADPSASVVRRFGNATGGFLSASSASLSVESGDGSVQIGGAAAAVDDADADGFGELLLSVYRHPDQGDGRVAVVPGALTGTWLLADVQSSYVYATWGDSAFGATVATGDLDGDGITDAVVGAPELDYSLVDNGALVYVDGPFVATRAMSDCAGLIYGNDNSEALGAVQPVIADVNGDGANEVVASSTLTGAGVYVFPGQLPSAADWAGLLFESQLLDPGGASEFGAALAVGDLDGDGGLEVAVGAPSAGGVGAVYIFAGPMAAVSFTTAAASASLQATAGASRFGASLAVLGDADGDGFGDLVVGAPFDATAGTDAGAVWFFAGGGY